MSGSRVSKRAARSPVKEDRRPFYAVRVGRVPGVYRTWLDCQAQTRGFGGAMFKKFETRREAAAFAGSTIGLSHRDEVAKREGKSSRARPTFKAPPPKPAASKRVRRAPASSDDETTEFSDPEPSASSDTDTAKSSNADEKPVVTLFTDGSRRGKGGCSRATAGYGVYWGEGHKLNASEAFRVDELQSNNRAEVMAVIRGVHDACETDGDVRDGSKTLRIVVDSSYAVGLIYAAKAAASKPRNKGPPNADLYVRAYEVMARYPELDLVVERTDGHIGVAGNEAADVLAKAGSKAGSKAAAKAADLSWYDAASLEALSGCGSGDVDGLSDSGDYSE